MVLTWTDPKNSSITRWKFRRKDGNNAWGAWTPIASSGASTTTHTVTQLTNGTAYQFRVRAVNATGDGEISDTVTATPEAFPPAPTGLTATGGNRTVTLAWTSGGGAGITGWRFRMRAGSLGWDHDPRWFDIPGGAAARTHTVTGLENYTEYGFQVAAINHIGPGYASNEARATPLPVVPAAPTDLAGTAGDRQITLRWTPGDDGGSPVTSWQYRQKEGINAWGEWTDVPANDVVTGLTNGTTYRFKVRGVNAVGNGAESAESDPIAASAAAPAAPAGLAAKTATTSSVTLSWTSPGDLSITDWQYEQAAPPAVPFDGAWYSIPGAGATTGTVTGVSGGRVWSFKIRAVNGIGASPASAAVQPRPAAPAPAVAKGVGQLSVSWTAPANLGPAISGYTVQWKSGGESFGSTRQATVTGVTHQIGSLTNGTEYSIRVRASNSAGDGDWSSVVTGTPSADPPLKPSRPQATAGNALVSLTWTAGGNGGAAITSWKYRQKAGAGDWGDWTPIPGSGASTTSHTVTTLTNGTEYTFQVRAVNSAGDGTASDDSNPVTPSTSGPTVPAAPASLQATPGNAQAVLSWTAGDDGDAAITSWKVRQKEGTNAWGAWTPIADSDAATTSHTATTLTNGTEYTFQVRAVNSAGDGAASAETTATPAGPPGAPTDLKVNVESHQRLLAAWLAPSDTGGAAITHYLVQWKSGTQEFSTARQVRAGVAADTDAYVKRSIFDLTNGTTYTLRVQAVNSAGAGPWSSTVTGTPKATAPDAPVIEVAKGNTRLEVSWTAPASNGSDITGYTVQWKTPVQNFDSTRQKTVTGTTASITGLTNGTQYTLRVRATNGIGDGPWSGLAQGTPSAVPEAPAGLVIRTWDRFLTFGWTAPEDNGSDITGYTVQWKSGDEEFGAENRHHTTTKTQHSWGALVNGTGYTYRVRATNANGDGPWSAEKTGIPGHAPAKPTPFTATGGDAQATLAWTSGGDGGSPITKWQIRRLISTNVWGDWADIDGSGASTTSHTVTGLDNGRTYTFQVRAVNTTGGGAASDSSVATMVPAKPAGFAATPNDGSVALSWTNPNNTSITRWEYRYKTGTGDFGSWTEVANSSASTTSASVTLANGKTYGFELRAVNATGDGTASDEATATMIPAAPANFAAASGNAKAHLSWTDPGNATITRWEYRVDSHGLGWQAWTEMSGSTASTTSHLIGSLDNNTSYRFEVRAVNATGNGKPSDAVTVRPRDVSVRLRVSPADHGEDEGAATVTVTATLAHANAGQPDTFPGATTVTVKVGASGDSATSGTDYTAVDDFVVTIPANSRSGTGTFTLTPTNDIEGEDLETITIAGTAAGLSVTGASLTLSDDDTYAFVFSKATVNLEETASPTGTYTVRLSKRPTDQVTVTVASGDSAAVTPNPATLTFTTSDYRTAQTVTLTAAADGDGDDESVSITHAGSGGGYASVTGTVTAAIEDDDSAPTANAGADRQGAMGATVTLDGSASADPEGATLTYAWSHTGGSPPVTLTGAATASPSFTAPTGLTQNAMLTFTLTVTDPGGRSATDTVTVTVVTTANNQAPTADAGADLSVREGAFVTLDGSGTSDPELETLTWAWTQKLTALPPLVPGQPLPPATPVVPIVTLTGADTARPTFTAPEVTEDTPITFVLTVTDGADNTSTDEVTITVKNNQPPAANAGPDQTVSEGAAVTLDGSGSNDLDRGDTVTYAWTQTGGSPTVKLAGADTSTATFAAPSQLAATATLTFTLTLSDGLKSDSDTVNVTVTAGANDAPAANAGADQRVAEGATVTLDGSASADPEGQTLTYSWTQAGSPPVTLSSTTAAKPTFTAPSSLASDAVLTFTLTVTDPGGLTATDTMTVTVPTAANNTAPTANAGPDRTEATGATVTLDGSASSDPEGEALTYAWTRTAGPNVTLSSTTAARPTFTAPSSAATLTFSLTVTAGGKTSAADTVTITVQASTAPTANAGADQTVTAGTTVTLDGSASSDPENQALTYAWTQTAGTTVTLSSATAIKPTFTAPSGVTSDETLTFSLRVTDPGGLASAADTVTVTVTPRDRPPTAEAGADRTAHEAARVSLDGSASSDPDGDVLAFAWIQTTGPAVTLTGADTATPRFQAPAQLAADTGLTFRLTVTAGGKTATDTVMVVVKAGANDAPTANAGADQRVGEAAAVTLDGSASSDPEGETLTYAWTQTAGTTVNLSSATAASPTFTAPSVTADETLTFSLTVTDARGLASAADTVTVTVRNGAPAAHAGPDQTVTEGATVTLDGSASSDPDNETLTYAWTQTAGTNVTLSSATAASPTFTAPSNLSTDATLTFKLVVTDSGGVASAPDTVTVTVQTNTAPTADAGSDQLVAEGATVTLDGSGSRDAESRTLTYAWAQTGGSPSVVLGGAATASPRFTAPTGLAQDAALVFTLTVTDGRGLTDTDTVTVTVTAASNNQAPTADAGADQTISEGLTVTLDGSASSDREGETLTYAWTQTGTPAVTLSSTTAAKPTFTAPAVAADTTLTFSLTVTAGGKTSTADTVTVTVKDNAAPVANAGPDQTVVEDQTVTLDGSGSSDPDGQTLTYAWTQPGGPPVTLSSTTVAKPTFTAPDVLKTTVLTFRLTVTDPLGRTSTADTVQVAVQVNTAPAANAGPDQTVTEGVTVTLDGSASSDPESQTLSYAWTRTAGPAVTLSSATATKPTFTAPAVNANTALTFSLTVTDPGGLTSTDTVTVTVGNNAAPTANAGADQTVAEDQTVTLDGSASSDPDNHTLSYAWTQTAGATVALSSTTAVRPTFTAPKGLSNDATLTFSLTVTDPGGLTSTDTVTVTVTAAANNTAPTANAGANQTVTGGTRVTLDGSASSDPQNHALTYSWTQTGGTPTVAFDAGSATPTFVAPVVVADTTLTFSLTVTDSGGLASSPDTVTVTVTANVAPTANAGADRRAAEGATVTLDGSASTDLDNHALTYAWTQTGGTPDVTLTGANTAKPTFTAPTGLASDASLTFTLTVTDPGGLTDTDTVTITVPTAANNTAPTANAGPDRTAATGMTVTLDGSASSDPEGETLSYAWTQTAGTNVTLSNATAARPTFTAPASASTLTFSLTVSAGGMTSTADTVTITVQANTAPTANAGPDRTAATGAKVTLDGSASSDPEGETLSYAWTQTAGTNVTLSSATAARPTFTAPASASTLTFSLTVTAGGMTSAADTVTITVQASTAPTADAGADQTVEEGALAVLDGSASSDPENQALTYAWTQTGGSPNVTLSSTSTTRPFFTAPSVTADTDLVFSLTVTDPGGLSSAADTVTITVRNNVAPTANAGADQRVAEGAAVTLDGSGSSDPEGGTLAYAWAQTSGSPNVMLTGAATAKPTFTAPSGLSANAVLTFTLTVTDPQGNAGTDTVTVTVPTAANNTAPTANAGLDQTVAEAAAVTLDGSGSSDPEGDALTWAWSQTAGPTVTLTEATTASPTFTAPSQLAANATLTFSLTVTAGGKTSTADTVTVTVTAGTNDAPTARAGTDRRVAESATVTLDGNGSSDPEGETLTYAWTQTTGTTVQLSSSTAAKPTFTAPSSLSANETLTFSLTVADARNLSSTADTVDVTVVSAANNQPPTADAGKHRKVKEGAKVQLDGSGSSDPEGEPLTFAWTQKSGPKVTLNGADTARPRFRAPTQLVSNIRLIFRLTVTAGGKTATDTVRVRVLAGANDAPTADAGANQTTFAAFKVTLDGSGSSDPEGQTLKYAWAQLPTPPGTPPPKQPVTKPPGTPIAHPVTLSSPSAVSPTFTAPTVSQKADLVFGLKVTDPAGLESLTDTVRVTVRPDSRGITLSKSNLTVPEGGEAGYTVKLAAQPLANVTVRVARKTGPEDRSLTVKRRTKTPGRTLTFTTSNWNTGQTVKIRAAEDDDGDNGTAKFVHTASGGGYNGITAQLTATESDNDTVSIVLSTASLTVGEGSTKDYKVKLATQPSDDVTVTVARKTTGTQDSDISVKTGSSLTFTTSNWNTDQTVTLQAAEDNDGEDGTAVIKHSASGGGYGSITAELTATESDNDTKAFTLSSSSGVTVAEGSTKDYKVKLATRPSGDVTVTVARKSGNNEDSDISVKTGSSLTFTTSNWNTDQTVTLEASEDHDGDNGTAVIRHTASGGGYGSVTAEFTATESDDDTKGFTLSSPTGVSVTEGSTKDYKVKLATKPSDDVTVTVARKTGSDQDSDISVKTGGTLTFTTSNWNTDQTVTLEASEDHDGDNGTAVIRHTASGGGYGSVTAEFTATESDNDTKGFTLSSPTGVSVTEGSTKDYKVKLATRPSDDVTVTVARMSGNEQDSDISVKTGGTLTFTTSNWNTDQTVTLEASEDHDGDNGTAVIKHSASGGGYGSVTAELTATESDNDTKGFTLSSPSGVTVTEGSTKDYKVKLATRPTDDVTVTVARKSGSGQDSDISVKTGGTLTFTTSNWNTDQTVTLEAAQDHDGDNGTAVIRHTASGGGYGSVTAELTATESDNDTKGFTLSSPSGVTVNEGSTKSYKVKLATQPSDDVTVTVARKTGNNEDSDISVKTGGTLTFTTSNWNTDQTVTLEASEDHDGDNGTAVIRHTASGGGYGSVTAEFTATESDNDTKAFTLSSSSGVTVTEGSTKDYKIKLATQAQRRRHRHRRPQDRQQ